MEISTYSLILFSKIEILSGQGVVQLEPNWDRVYHGYLESETKRIFAIVCLGKRLVFRTEICYYFK